MCKLELELSLRIIFGNSIGIAIGGDVFPGSTLSDHVLRFNNIPQVNQYFQSCSLREDSAFSLLLKMCPVPTCTDALIDPQHQWLM